MEKIHLSLLLLMFALFAGACKEEPHYRVTGEFPGAPDGTRMVLCLGGFNASADADPLAWDKAMAEDQPNYPQVRMVKDEHGKEMVDYYGTVVLPYTLLLDGEGKIVSIGARGAVLDFVLSKLLENE